jgi:hypothetical protein
MDWALWELGNLPSLRQSKATAFVSEQEKFREPFRIQLLPAKNQQISRGPRFRPRKPEFNPISTSITNDPWACTYPMMGKRIGEFLKIILTSAGSGRPEETECTIEGIHESSRWDWWLAPLKWRRWESYRPTGESTVQASFAISSLTQWLEPVRTQTPVRASGKMQAFYELGIDPCNHPCLFQSSARFVVSVLTAVRWCCGGAVALQSSLCNKPDVMK